MKRLILLFFLFVGCSQSMFEPVVESGGNPYTIPPKIKVEYVVSGTATSALVTMNGPNGDVVQYVNAFLPKIYRYSDYKDWFIYVSAQNNGTTGIIVVAIFIDDVLYKSDTNSGAYVTAVVSGTI